MAGVTAFKEAFVSADLTDAVAFSDYTARQFRYQLLWAMFENTAYRDLHKWAPKLRADYGLYKYIRNIYNPAHRLSEFWQAHLFGGALDSEAGDGAKVPNALPIITDNAALRPAIAQVWRNSNWHSRKDIMTLWGAALGDVGLRVIDDPLRRKVYLNVVHPGTIRDIETDVFGNVKGYTLVETRPDPRPGPRAGAAVEYSEIAARDGDDVIYQTFLDGRPYGWFTDEDGKPVEEWVEPYGFVPLVLVKHIDVGLEWGWAEMQSMFSKVREVDDIASKLSDQVRKMVDAPFLFAGVEDPRKKKRELTATGKTPTTDDPEPGRAEIPVLYGPLGATATPLVAPLNIADAATHIKEMLAEIEREYPELQMDIWRASGDASGRALRTARQPCESKALQRRAGYDDAMVRGHQMAIAIAGFRGYAGFEGFDLDSYGAGRLDHRIGERPVFAPDPLDELQLEQQRNAVEIQRLTLEQQRALLTGR